LLEGLELYKEDWAAVAAHVGTRSQAACLMHFVRLPIEDQFIDDVAGMGSTTAAAATATASAAEAAAAAAAQASTGDAPTTAAAALARHGLLGVGPDGLPLLPFAEDQNPLMSLVGCLAVVAGPRVAAAAAQRALQVLVEGDEAAAKDLYPSMASLAAAAAAAAASAAGDATCEARDGHDTADASAAAAAAAAADGIKPEGDAMDVDGTASATAGEAVSVNNVLPPVVDPNQPISQQLTLAAAAAGLAAAAARAKQLAEAEEREIQRLMVTLVDIQTKKVDYKEKLLQELGGQVGQSSSGSGSAPPVCVELCNPTCACLLQNLPAEHRPPPAHSDHTNTAAAAGMFSSMCSSGGRGEVHGSHIAGWWQHCVGLLVHACLMQIVGSGYPWDMLSTPPKKQLFTSLISLSCLDLSHPKLLPQLRVWSSYTEIICCRCCCQVVDRERQAAEVTLRPLANELLQLTEQRKKAEAAKAVRQQQQAAVAKQKAQLAQQQKEQQLKDQQQKEQQQKEQQQKEQQQKEQQQKEQPPQPDVKQLQQPSQQWASTAATAATAAAAAAAAECPTARCWRAAAATAAAATCHATDRIPSTIVER
jgi:hypothetical protein